MASMFGGGKKVKIRRPPPPPPPPPPSPEEVELRRTETALLRQNLDIQQQLRSEQETSRRAFEQELGLPLPTFLARQAREQVDLGRQFREFQGDIFRQARSQREAFQSRLGLTPEEAAAEEARLQFEQFRRQGGLLERQDVLFRGLQERAQQELAREQALRGEFQQRVGFSPEAAQAEEARLQFEQFRRQGGLLERQDVLFRGLQERAQQELAREQSLREEFQRRSGFTPEAAQAEEARRQLELEGLIQQQSRAEIQRRQEEREAFRRATGLTPEEAGGQEAERELVLSRGLFDRFQAALAGKLPVSPGLEQSLKTQRATLEESLRSQLGPGFAVSTPGIQALSEFDERAEALREASRRGAITEAEQVGFAGVPATERARRAFAGGVDRTVLSPGLQALLARGQGGVPSIPGLVLTPGLQRILASGQGGVPSIPGLGLTPGVSRSLLAESAALSGVGGVDDPLLLAQGFQPRGFLTSPPQLGSLLSQFGLDRSMAFKTGLAGAEQEANFINALNKARIGAAGAQAQAQGGLLSSLIEAGATLGAAALFPPAAPFIAVAAPHIGGRLGP